MTTFQKGFALAAVQCALVLSLAGKLVYDRAVYPRIWVKATRRDPELPIRGRYLALQLTPAPGDPNFNRLNHQPVVFFMPETATEMERAGRRTVDVWAEVTIPRSGPPRPIRLGILQSGQIRPLDLK